MSCKKITDFMVQIAKDLVENKDVTQSTVNAYLRILYVLNDKVPFKSLSFLRNKEGILNKINGYAENTQKTQLAAIVSVLSSLNKPTYSSLHKFYVEKLLDKRPITTENQKTEKQKDNWIDWKTILDISKEQWDKVSLFSTKTLTSNEEQQLLEALILALYVYVPPRRNQDYLDMVVVKKWNDSMPKDVNYLDMSEHKFIFNKYKTCKKYGTQEIKIDDTQLRHIISIYLKHHNLYKQSKGKTPVSFLISNGKPLVAINSITRVLNRIFKKRVGSSMLRHIFLSDKYGDTLEQQKEDSNAMGHSLDQQREYIKNNESVKK